MNYFPDNLIPKNRALFSGYRLHREIAKLREKVVEYLYCEEKGGIDLRSRTKDGVYTYEDINDEVVDRVIKELESMGWKSRLAYNKTVLFVYEDEKELPNIEVLDSIEEI